MKSIRIANLPCIRVILVKTGIHNSPRRTPHYLALVPLRITARQSKILIMPSKLTVDELTFQPGLEFATYLDYK